MMTLSEERNNQIEANWSIHLLQRNPWRIVVLVPIIFFTLVFLRALSADWFIIVLALVIFIFAIAEFILPLHYRIDDMGVHMRFFGSHRLLRWTNIRRVYCYKNEIFLSTLAKHSRLEGYRGLLLRCDDTQATLLVLRNWFEAKGLFPEIIEDYK